MDAGTHHRHGHGDATDRPTLARRRDPGPRAPWRRRLARRTGRGREAARRAACARRSSARAGPTLRRSARQADALRRCRPDGRSSSVDADLADQRQLVQSSRPGRPRRGAATSTLVCIGERLGRRLIGLGQLDGAQLRRSGATPASTSTRRTSRPRASGRPSRAVEPFAPAPRWRRRSRASRTSSARRSTGSTARTASTGATACGLTERADRSPRWPPGRHAPRRFVHVSAHEPGRSAATSPASAPPTGSAEGPRPGATATLRAPRATRLSPTADGERVLAGDADRAELRRPRPLGRRRAPRGPGAGLALRRRARRA